MISHSVKRYFSEARSVARSIGSDAYVIDERSSHVVRSETNGNFSVLGPLEDGSPCFPPGSPAILEDKAFPRCRRSQEQEG